MFKIKSFRQNILIGFVLAAFLPLIFLGFFSYSYLSSKIEESVNLRNELLARNIAIEICSYLNRPEIFLQQTAMLLRETSSERKEKDNLLNDVVANSDFIETIYLIDEQKVVINIGLEKNYVKLAENHLGNDLSGLNILKNIQYFEG